MIHEFLLAITWDVSPSAIKLGSFEIRWYGLLFASAFLVGQNIMLRIFRAEGKPEKDLESMTLYMVLGTVLGARLGHCLFYDPDYYLSNPIKILMIWEGGLASHGGAIGILLALWLYARNRADQPYLWVLDRIAIVAALGGCFIRLGNLMNSEIVGAPTDVPWAFEFVNSYSLSQAERLIPRHPAQLYESLSCLILFLLLFALYWKSKEKLPQGRFFGIFLAWIFGLRFFYEFIKENQVAFEDGMRSSLGLNMGQILSVPLVFIGITFLVRSFQQRDIES